MGTGSSWTSTWRGRWRRNFEAVDITRRLWSGPAPHPLPFYRANFSSLGRTSDEQDSTIHLGRGRRRDHLLHHLPPDGVVTVGGKRRPAGLAQVLVPDWGGYATILEINGDELTLEGFRQPRVLKVTDCNWDGFFPTRNGIEAFKDGRTTTALPCPPTLKGAEWREWSTRRIKQIHNCRRLGWRVRGWALEGADDDAEGESTLEIGPGAVVGKAGTEAVLRLEAANRTTNPALTAWNFHGRGKPPPESIYPRGYLPGDRVWLPRGVLPWPASPMVERERPREVLEGVSPFWYQAEAVDAVLKSGHGIVEAPCGAGKTGIGTFLASRVAGRVLVVVHTLDLVRQWVDRLSTWLPGVSVGQLGGGKKPKGEEIVVASLSTLARWEWSQLGAFGRDFSLLVADECHHVPAETWLRVVAGMPCRYRVGLTATPKRKDGLETWMALALGPTVYRIDQETLDRAGRTMAPEIVVLNTGHEVAVGEHPAATMRGVLEDRQRDAQVQRAVRRLVADGRRVLVLTSLVDHAESLAEAVGGSALVGRCTTRKRQAVLEAVRAGSLSVVVATQLADEGLDLPELDAVVLAAPSSHKPATRQRVGRACRALEGKRTPIVVDVVDAGQWAARKWSARRALYRSLGWTIRREA